MTELDHELTESIHQKVCEALRFGASYELAARYAGVKIKWFWRWKKLGERPSTTLNEECHQRYKNFSEDIQTIRADYELNCLKKMEILGRKNWKPVQWKYLRVLEARLSGNLGSKKNKKRKEVRHERE